MKMTIKVPMDFYPVRLIVEAGVRYWEDADVNGEEDTDGSRIPFRSGGLWKPIIDLHSGQVEGWPQGTTARVHYKVCDAGEYWLVDVKGRKVKWKGYYVPESLLCFGGEGYGDYIILDIDSEGKIRGWKQPDLDGDDWNIEGAVITGIVPPNENK